MNQEQALAIDKRLNILPGGQGEHDFNLLWSPKQIDESLNNYAECCGGLFYLFGDTRITASLYAGDEGAYRIDLSPERDRVIKIWQLHSDDRITLYWDWRRERNEGWGYQYGNAKKPFLEDLELSIAEFDADEARQLRELAETPPPPPPKIDHDKIFRQKLGLTDDEIRCPKLQLQLINWNHEGKFINEVLWEGEATLEEAVAIKEQWSDKWSGYSPLIYLVTDYGEPSEPRVGDIIRRVRQPGQYMHGNQGIFDKRWDDELACTYSPSPFWNPIYALHKQGSPSCSGGSCDTPVIEKCIHAGRDLRMYWYWRDGWAGASKGANYYCIVDVWHWID